MIRKGCTACFDLTVEFLGPSPEGIAAVASAYRDAGMRAVVAPMISSTTSSEALAPATRSGARCAATQSVLPGRNVMLYKDDAPAVEVGVEIEAPFDPIGRVISSMLPSGRVVMTTHRGSWEVGPAYGVGHRRLRGPGLERVGPRWEIYGHWNKPGDEEVEVYYLVR